MAYPRSRRSRVHKFVRLTTGDLSPSVANTNWTAIHATAFDLTLPAQVGDTIACTFSFRMSGGNNTYTDAFTLVSGNPINGISGQAYVAGSGSGVGGLFLQQGGSQPVGGVIPYTLAAGDLSTTGTVTVRPYVRQNVSGSALTVFASTTGGVALFGLENLCPPSQY